MTPVCSNVHLTKQYELTSEAIHVVDSVRWQVHFSPWCASAQTLLIVKVFLSFVEYFKFFVVSGSKDNSSKPRNFNTLLCNPKCLGRKMSLTTTISHSQWKINLHFSCFIQYTCENLWENFCIQVSEAQDNFPVSSTTEVAEGRQIRIYIWHHLCVGGHLSQNLSYSNSILKYLLNKVVMLTSLTTS